MGCKKKDEMPEKKSAPKKTAGKATGKAAPKKK